MRAAARRMRTKHASNRTYIAEGVARIAFALEGIWTLTVADDFTAILVIRSRPFILFLCDCGRRES